MRPKYSRKRGLALVGLLTLELASRTSGYTTPLPPITTTRKQPSRCNFLTQQGNPRNEENDDEAWVSMVQQTATRNPRAKDRNNKAAAALPPWLSRHVLEKDEVHVEDQLKSLEFALMEQSFSSLDISDVFLTMEAASKGDKHKLAGMTEFLSLLVELEADDDDHKSHQHSHVLVTKEVLLASALHYGDCVTARETGVYEMVREAIFREPQLLSPASPKQQQESDSLQLEVTSSDHDDTAATSHATTVVDDVDAPEIASSSSVMLQTANVDSDYSPEFTQQVMTIARGAARVKRAEIMAHTILGEKGRTKEEASRLRGLLLSVMDDWRALMIRAVACLYRLKGLLRSQNSSHEQDYTERSPEVVLAAREALFVYAPLAQRLGMQRLKMKIEDAAFQILYKRQYRAVSDLYQTGGPAMKAVSKYLETQIRDLLFQNHKLMDQLESLEITSRVKEPYSSWRKLLQIKAKKDTPPMLTSADRVAGSSLVSTTEVSQRTDLSLGDIQDGAAVRIILKAKKMDVDEPDETTRARERILCYIVQHMIRNEWPVLDESRIKDYIQFPKPNGYQSLHYSSAISYNRGLSWPFEVQVRSEEMHRTAEYGVAAHSDYKLGAKTIDSPTLNPQQRLPLAMDEQDVVVLSDGSTEFVIPTSVRAAEAAAGESYIDALVTAKEDLVQEKVFVFLTGATNKSKGQLLSLPVGAKVRDAITELSDGPVGLADAAKITRNGQPATDDSLVGNGDVLVISM